MMLRITKSILKPRGPCYLLLWAISKTETVPLELQSRSYVVNHGSLRIYNRIMVFIKQQLPTIY
jgi:hypothetical protein